MLTINSSSYERTTAWLKPTQLAPNAATASAASTVSLQRNHADTDRVSLSSEGVAQTQAASEAPKENPYANTIVNLLRQQLQRDQADGASNEAIASRLAAGYQGFLQGFNEAYAMLGGASALPEEVNSALAETKDLVGQAVAKLAQEFGVQAPEIQKNVTDPGLSMEQALNQLAQTTQTEAPATRASNGAGHSAIAQLRSLNLQLTTAEGDIIELIANSKYAAAVDSSEQGVRGSAQQSSQWSLSVQGDLNDNERASIADFLNQLGGLADEFYQGDLAQAVKQAQHIGFDNAQISAFSISMQQVDIQRVENAYSGPQAGSSEIKNPAQTRWQLMGQWLQQLDQLRTESIEKSLPQYWITQLTQQSLAQWYPDNKSENDFLTSQVDEK